MMTKPISHSSAKNAADLIYHLARLASQTVPEQALTPAQWAALRYFDRASTPSRNPSGFASFHATTRGTASQTIKSLEMMGYVTRTRSGRDGRRIRFDLTPAGRSLMQMDPLGTLEAAISLLPEEDVLGLSAIVHEVLGHVAAAQGEGGIGTCDDCALFRAPPPCGDEAATCLYTDDPLDGDDIGRLCVRFSQRSRDIETQGVGL